MGIGTFGAFTQARLAIYAAQTGLSVTGNNISNINTPGYTRQRLNQVSLYTAGSDRYYSQTNIRTGQGVLPKSVSQIRNPYLDIRFREENAKVGYQDARLEGLNSIAQILDEVGKGVDEDEGYGIVALEISKLIDALQDLTTQTGHQEYDNIVRQVAANLVSRLNSYAARLEGVRQDTITSFDQNVDEINDILTGIRSYNEEIRKCEIHGDPALELRDERNLLIDRLSGLIDINVTYSEEEIAAGLTVEKLTIRLGNANPNGEVETDESLLVDGIFCAQLSKGKPMENPYLKMTEEEWNKAKAELETELREKLKEELRASEGYAGITDEEIADTDNEPGKTFNEDLNKLVEEALTSYRESPYWNEEAGEPTDDIRDATILTGEDNENFDIIITALKNQIGELHQAYEKDAEVKIEDPAIIAEIDKKFGKNNSFSEEAADIPDIGDTTVTIYKRIRARDATGKPLYEETKNDDGTVTRTPVYNYTKQVVRQIVSKPVALDDNDLGGELQANRELLTEKGEFVDMSVITDVDENAASKRGIQYYQRSLDLLAQQLAKLFNDANQGFYVDPAGNYISPHTEVNEDGEDIVVPVTITATQTDDNGNPVKDENGDDVTLEHILKRNDDLYADLDKDIRAAILTAVGLGGGTSENDLKEIGLTSQDIINAYLNGQTYEKNTESGEYELKDADPNDPSLPRGIFAGGVLFSNGNNSDDPTGITAANISISATWQKSHILVCDFTCPVNSLEPASGASDNILHMKYLLDTQKWDFYPDTLEGTEGAGHMPMFNGTIFEYWNNVGFTLGKDQDYSTTELTVAYETALSIDTDRSSVSSVDFNDEAMNLMMYSKSYNAACRLMTTIDSVLDKLINGTGLTT